MNSNNSHYFTNNFYINNVDRMIIPSTHQNIMKPSRDEVFVEDIMNLCHQNFRNILPNKINYNFDSKTFLFPFEKNQIVELINQIDTCIQLLLQNLFLCPNNSQIRLDTYNLLVNRFCKETPYDSFSKALPKFKISLSTFKPQSSGKGSNVMESNDAQIKSEMGSTSHNNNNKLPLFFTATPQLSVFHSPLIAFLEKFRTIMSRNLSRENILEIFHEFTPFINKHWIPIFNVSANPASRSKFTPIDDNLLLIGIKKYGTKEMDKIQKNYLPDQKTAAIRNRYKNLICTRAIDNPIKKWKHLQISSLTEEEKQCLINGVKWFGSLQKTYVISKYFLPDRSPSFLEDELNNNEKLIKKRKKYGLTTNPEDQVFFQSLKEMCSKMEENNSKIGSDQIKEKTEKMDLEIEENHNDIDRNQNLSFNNEKNFSAFSNYSPQDKERTNRGFKRSNHAEKIEMENGEENYKTMSYDKESLSGVDQEEGVEIFIDSKNNKTYKFVDDMTFECDEI